MDIRCCLIRNMEMSHKILPTCYNALQNILIVSLLCYSLLYYRTINAHHDQIFTIVIILLCKLVMISTYVDATGLMSFIIRLS